MLCAAHVLGVHADTPHLYATPPPPHVVPAGHGAQFTVPPQPSGTVPQSAPCWAHVRAVQLGPPHWPSTPPPPHVWPFGHVPQFGVVPPQPSLWTPHVPAG